VKRGPAAFGQRILDWKTGHDKEINGGEKICKERTGPKNQDKAIKKKKVPERRSLQRVVNIEEKSRIVRPPTRKGERKKKDRGEYAQIRKQEHNKIEEVRENSEREAGRKDASHCKSNKRRG